ncbi:MAG: thiol peroxidase [Planctomycetes bacterium]|nr:thiol peroxidase [Planctomycetota bacterium]
MTERAEAITFKGDPMTLVGDELQVGEAAPDFSLIGNDLTEVKLSDYRGKVCIICSVPSLDTGVCDVEMRRFNQEAEHLGAEVVVLTVSMDLPFAQARWCGALKVKRILTLSDYRGVTFGQTYGVLIKELHLLARCVWIVDQDGVIQYIQLVPEVTAEPNYEAALKMTKQLKEKVKTG